MASTTRRRNERVLRSEELDLFDALRCRRAPGAVQLADDRRHSRRAVDAGRPDALVDGDVEQRPTGLSNEPRRRAVSWNSALYLCSGTEHHAHSCISYTIIIIRLFLVHISGIIPQ